VRRSAQGFGGKRTVAALTLTEIFRQAASSQIIVNAHRINRGHMPVTPETSDTDFYMITADPPEDIQAKLLRVVTERIPQRFGLHPIRDVQGLTPMNRGSLGARAQCGPSGGPQCPRDAYGDPL
jgi:exodeoxyribonuclease V alpha subunit